MTNKNTILKSYLANSKNTILKAIDYIGIYATKSPQFTDFKFIGKSIDNPLQVSYIKQQKIDGLLEHTKTKIVGTKEQRQKHFTSTTIFKLLDNLFINEADRITTIASDIDKELRKEFCSDADLFIENDLSGFYSQENKNYIYNANGSCMSKKRLSYFDIYDNFINTKAQIVGLKVGKSVIARAILWTKTTKTAETQYISLTDKKAEKRLKDKNLLGTITNSIETKKYFLDRIYISKDFENSNKSELQNKLYNKIKRALKIKALNCFSLTYVKKIHTSDKLNYFNSKSYPDFSIQIKQDDFHALTHYPYMDTFRWGNETANNIKFSDDDECNEYILECTQGSYTEGADRVFCECCEENMHEDTINYSSIEEEQLCDDCCTYIEERDDIVRNEHATYNNYTGLYHYTQDLD